MGIINAEDAASESTASVWVAETGFPGDVQITGDFAALAVTRDGTTSQHAVRRSDDLRQDLFDCLVIVTELERGD